MEHFTDDVRGVVLDSAGHWLANERPDALSVLLLPFLS